MGTRIANNTYRVTARLSHAGSDGDMDDAPIIFELGEVGGICKTVA